MADFRLRTTRMRMIAIKAPTNEPMTIPAIAPLTIVHGLEHESLNSRAMFERSSGQEPMARSRNWSIGQTDDAGQRIEPEFGRRSDYKFELSSSGRPPEMGRAFRCRCYTGPRKSQRCSHSNRMMLSMLFGYLHNIQIVRGSS